MCHAQFISAPHSLVHNCIIDQWVQCITKPTKKPAHPVVKTVNSEDPNILGIRLVITVLAA